MILLALSAKYNTENNKKGGTGMTARPVRSENTQDASKEIYEEHVLGAMKRRNKKGRYTW
jgi:hypothetical protein